MIKINHLKNNSFNFYITYCIIRNKKVITMKKELFLQIDNILLNSPKPSVEIGELIKQKKFDTYPFTLIKNLKDINQNINNHPEGNVLNHTLLVIDKASFYKKFSKNPRVFMWASLLHDIGKLNTTKIIDGKITAYGHDIESEKLAKIFFANCGIDDIVDNEFINKVCGLVKYHMQPTFFYKHKSRFNLNEILENVDINELCLVSLCDRLGRDIDDDKIKCETTKIKEFKQFLQDREVGGK